MNWEDILKISGLTTGAIFVLGYFLRDWLLIRLRESVRAEYQEQLGKLKTESTWQYKRKEQSAELAKLFSIWLHPNYMDTDKNKYRHELQEKYWEVALWLEASILQVVHKAFESSGTREERYKEAMILLRKSFHGEDDPITPEDLLHWNAS